MLLKPFYVLPVLQMKLISLLTFIRIKVNATSILLSSAADADVILNFITIEALL